MAHRYRLLALDVDGTLLDAQGLLQPRTALAVSKAAEAGIQPVLCTGRRYRRALPIAQELGLEVPIVCNSGALVKNPRDHSTLWRADLDLEVVRSVLDIFAEFDQPAVSFADNPPDQPDFVISRERMGRSHFDDYLDRNQGHARVSSAWPERIDDQPHYHICAIDTVPTMLELQKAIHAMSIRPVQTFVQKSPRYIGTMCEILRVDASKWTALTHLAQLWGIDPSEICAIGDDMNDIQMIAQAGFGVAMGHAPPAVMEVADHVTGDHHSNGVAMLIEDILLGSH